MSSRTGIQQKPCHLRRVAAAGAQLFYCILNQIFSAEVCPSGCRGCVGESIYRRETSPTDIRPDYDGDQSMGPEYVAVVLPVNKLSSLMKDRSFGVVLMRRFVRILRAPRSCLLCNRFSLPDKIPSLFVNYACMHSDVCLQPADSSDSYEGELDLDEMIDLPSDDDRTTYVKVNTRSATCIFVEQ
jgi:hypothetical protein